VTGILYSLARFCVRRHWTVMVIWLAIAVAVVAVSHQMGDNTNDNLSLPGTNSYKATSTLARSFPDQSNGTSPIVIHAGSGKLTDSSNANAVNQAAADVAKEPFVASVVNPLTQQGAAQLSKDQATGYLSVTLSVPPGQLSQEQAQQIINGAQPARAAGLEVQTGGQLGQKVSQPATESSELIGIIAALLILTFTLGTIVAAVLPILSAIIGLVITLGVIRMLEHALTVPTVAPTLATMIGLGVGIDYSLFIVTRHFRGMKDGLPLDESIARAAATSGGAVFFAGCTVTIALVSLAVAGIPLVTTMGEMAAIAVVVAVIAALTLLPAILGALGPHIEFLRVRPHVTDAQARNGLWAKWAGEIAKVPVVALLAALAILIPLMIPLFSLTLGQQDTGAFSKSTTVRQAYDLMSENFGPGSNGPLLIAVALKSPAQSTSDSRLTTLQKDIAGTSGVAAVTPITLSKDGTTAFFNAIAKTAPSATATSNLVSTLRTTVIPKAESGANLSAYVGGSTAGYVDLASRISSKLPLQIAVVIALSFVLLILAFRTVVIPAQAAVMNVLSIAASYGVITAVFQYGWAHGVIGLEGAIPIVSYVPLFMFAILFGLSMDYEVFLVSQIEEHVHAGERNRSSVVSGLVTSARVITAAAAVMVCVFGSFVLNGNPTIKQFGIGLAVAVLLDATVVRCLLVPALMVLMGRINWYFPHWMERLVPRVSIEGAEFFHARDEAVDASAAESALLAGAVPDQKG
jgi:putative drug exporter of the RND superfamily